MKLLKEHAVAVVVIVGVILAGYWGLWRSFFEQDEWHTFARYIQMDSATSGAEFWRLALSGGPLSHFTPGALFTKMVFYEWFNLDAAPYFWVSLVWHCLVAVAVYVLVWLVMQKRWPALVGSVFFAINGSHYQAVTWLGNFEGTEGAALWGILSLICFWFYAKRGGKFWIWSCLSVFVGLLFKEVALTFWLVLVSWSLLGKVGGRKKVILGLVTLAVLWWSLRYVYLFFGANSLSGGASQGARSYLLTVLYNGVTLPIKVWSEVFLPQSVWVGTAKWLSARRGEIVAWRGPWVSWEAIYYDVITFFVGLAVMVSSLLLVWKKRRNRGGFLGLALVILSIVPFLALTRYLVVLDSRYLYLATIGVSLILSLALMSGWGVRRKWIKWGVGGLVLVLIGGHYLALRGVVSEAVAVGGERRAILEEMKKDFPTLPKRVVFYTESDSSYYGLPEGERILPFQSGVGEMLLVWYEKGENWPREFFQNEFLWGITDQGYKEAGEEDLDILEILRR